VIHREPECRVNTKTLPDILSAYGVAQEALKDVHVGIPDPALCIKTGRNKYGRKSGVLCYSDDNVTGRPLQDLTAAGVTLEQGAFVECSSCPFRDDGTCKETVLVLFTINAPDDSTPAPCGNMLFKMSLPRTARNPFFGDYALAMQTAYNTVLRYGLDHRHFPQGMIPFRISLVLRNGQYFDTRKNAQVKTSYYVPQISLDYARLCSRLEKFAEQFGGRQLYAPPEKLKLAGTTEPMQAVTPDETPEEREIVDSYLEPDPPLTEADMTEEDAKLIAEMQSTIYELLEMTGWANRHKANSVRKHLFGGNPGTVKDCDDPVRLEAYIEHLQEALDGQEYPAEEPH